jgi:hypothetical protein
MLVFFVMEVQKIMLLLAAFIMNKTQVHLQLEHINLIYWMERLGELYPAMNAIEFQLL